MAATVLGFVAIDHRFASRDHFAAYSGTAPIEVSSGNRRCTVSRVAGNRQLNHAIHMAAVTQIRNPGTAGYIYYHRKRAEGMGRKAALRALKRKISDAIYNRLVADSRSRREGPGRANGERLCIQRDRLTPQDASSSEKPLPGHRQAYDDPRPTSPAPHRRNPAAKPLDTKEASIGAADDLKRAQMIR